MVLTNDTFFMKHAFFLFAFALAASGIFSGCKDSSTNSGGGAIPGTMVGYVSAFDASENSTDNSGFKISIDGTSYSTLSDTKGRWELDNVIPGTYNISYTKDGFAMEKLVARSFAGNGTDYIPAQPIYQILPTNATLVLRPFDNGIATFTSRIYRNDPNESLGGFDVIYFGKDSSFNASDPHTYLYMGHNQGTSTSSGYDIRIKESDLISAGFTTDEKIYCTAYASNVSNGIWDIQDQKTIFIASYLDIATNRLVYTAFGDNPHSEVKSFILP